MLILLGLGYFLGGRVGVQNGAQQYTKKMWANNDMQLSSYAIFQGVNEFRQQNNLEPLVMEDGLCRLANNQAQYNFELQTSDWDQEQQQYKNDQQNSPESPEQFGQKILNFCPNCDLDSYDYAIYVSLRPESCWNYAGVKFCDGDEEFGMLEKYTDRVVKMWSEDAAMKQALLNPVDYGCVGAYGGSVVLSVSNLTQ